MNSSPKPRVALNFVRNTIAALIAFCRHVVTQMTGNPNFTTPFPTLATVTAAVDNLETANDNAMGGSRVDISLRRAARAELLSLMRQLAAYVQSHCQEDRTIILSSGFEPTKVPAPVGPVATPNAPIVRQGPTTGTLKARTGKVTGASAYNWRVALASDPTTYVQSKQTTGSRSSFSGLTAGQIYNVQVNALGSLGESDWSAAGNLMVI